MLNIGQIAWIRRLAADGLSHRQITRATGVARDSVRELLSFEEPEEEDLLDTLYKVENPVFTNPPVRCDGCGAVVFMPCLACGLRRMACEQKNKEADEQTESALVPS